MLDPAPPPAFPAPPPRRRWALAGLLLLAVGVRLLGLNWDQGANFHPDERRIAEAVTGMSFVPLQLNPHFFAYGSFPLYVTRVACSLAAWVDPWLGSYDGVIHVGRALAALWGTATVWILFLLARRLYGKEVGYLAAGILAICVLPVQNAHFFTNDIPLGCLVLLALYLGVRALDGGGIGHLAGAGLVTGLALATKISALPLGLPLALVAVLRWVPGRQWKRLGTWWAVGGAAVVLGFALGQPFAFLDSRAFLHDVIEQSQMVRHAGLFPYTNQYVGLPKGLYDLRELVVWGMGPPLGLAALAGWALAIRRGLRERRGGELVLLAWVVPFAVVTMSFDIKFPRYLLPIYPLLLLWGAVALQRWAAAGRLGRWLRVAVLAAAVAYLLAFLSIYLRPHTVRAASEWFYTHIPAGSQVLSQDWDEGFPQSLPGRSASAYKIVVFPFYEPDEPAKIGRLARETASADFIALQTKRIYGATTQAQGRFPLTSNYFYLLFAGDLGYERLADFASRPRLFGIELPSELADESFSVYDHPKVLIFRNTAHLAANELERRIRAAVPSHPITRRQMLLARASEATTRPPSVVRSSLLAVALVVGFLEVLGLAAWVLLAAAWGTSRPGLYALGKPVGVLALGLSSWWVVVTGWLPFSGGTVLALASALILTALLVWRRAHPTVPRREVLVSELVAWGGFALFLGLRLLNPEIFWGEKPMDFSFLNALYRTTTLPPPEPWFAGSVLHYTYFGHFLVAALGKAVAVMPAIMFNLGVGLVAYLVAAATLAAGAVLGGRLRVGVLAVGLCLLAGNLSGWRELIGRKMLSFDYFWATSRVIPNTINENPAWNLTFADLHAHVLAMPWALTLVALLLLALVPPLPPRRARALLWALAAAAMGALMITNGWSTPTYLTLVPWVALVAWFSSLDQEMGGRARLRSAFWGSLVPVLAVGAGSFLITREFWSTFSPPPRNWGWEVGPYARPGDVLTIFGLFWALVVPATLLLWWRARMAGRPALQRWLWGAGLGAAAALSCVDLGALFLGRLKPAASVAPLAAILLLLALAALRDAPPYRLPLALAAMALGLVLGCELLFVWDRMNTIFKFYLDAWLLLAVATAALAELALQPRGWGGRWWRGSLGVLGAAALFTSASGAWGAVTHRHISGPRWTLDGTAYLALQAPDEKAAFDWLNRTVPGLPVLVEAWGPSYQEFSRVSMHTGLPIILGWEYHVFQRSQSQTSIERRKQDVELIYTSASRAVVAATLARYHAALVFVGPLERQTYHGGNLARFRTWSDLLVPLYENPSVVIFGVLDALPGRFPLTTREAGRMPGEEEQSPPGRLREPRGVACNRDGNAVVADHSNHRIQILAPDGSGLASWGRRGSAPGELQEPTDVAVGPAGDIYVADTWNGRIQVFDPAGTYLREWSGNFYGPRGVAVAADGSVYVADTGNHRIVRFRSDGEKLGEWGRHGAGPGELYEPMGLAVDQAGNLVVCDSGNGRVQVFTPQGVLRGLFAVAGWRREVYSEPHVAVDRGGRLWVTVPLAGEVRAYNERGELLQTLARATVQPPLDKPVGIAVDPIRNQLVVTDIADRLLRLPLPPAALPRERTSPRSGAAP